MPPNELPPISVLPHGDVLLGHDALRNVVWVRGEHDVATRVNVSAVLAEASRLDEADIVVDLSAVTFMDASTIGALVDARNRLLPLSRSLSVRAPSPRARRVLDLSGLAELIFELSAPAQRLVAPALGSWVDVPASDRGASSAQSPVARRAPIEEPARVLARRRVEPARSVQERRAPS